MQRHMLRLTLVLGVLVTILGGTGVFATFSDRASGGSNSVTSGARPSAADIQIATATVANGATTCGTFADNTLTPQFTVTNLQPTSAATTSNVCLRNTGAATVSITTGVSGLRDSDPSCTGDEEISGDSTCGGDQEGELSRAVLVTIAEVSCSTGAVVTGRSIDLAELPAFPQPLSVSGIAPSATACVRLVVAYDPDMTEEIIQVAQSDTATWNFLFQATAA
jgi:predicted ribosomally synthesized peptide with SipW-like signal peptide